MKPPVRPSALMHRAWQEARDSAYRRGHGSEFDRLTSEIEALRAGQNDDATIEAMYRLVQQRKILAQPFNSASSAA
jgi:hypothetical protein